jgi:thioredoxin-dependent peroxiredoxin
MKKAPDFELPDQDGIIQRLKDYKGKWVVLYFYPKDDTPGCTLEACNFRDERESIAQLGNAEVIGVSKDSVKKHKSFASRYNLTFKLLSDEDGKTIEKYGAWKQKSMFGKTYLGIQRMTVIINPGGYIVKEYPKVNPRTHAAEIIKELRALQY